MYYCSPPIITSLPSQNTFLLSGVPPITTHLSLIRCPPHHKTPFSYQVSLPSQNTFLLSGVPPITKHLSLIRCLPHHKTAFSYILIFMLLKSAITSPFSSYFEIIYNVNFEIDPRCKNKTAHTCM
jgi:hypothetical protein